MKLTVLGSGDAFGSGGRLQTSFHVETGDHRFLIDCGATTLIGLDRQGLAANDVSTIFISHLHGDHFAGLVWWMLHGQHITRRTTPLTIAGPAGIAERVQAAAEALFPGSTAVKPRYETIYLEYARETPLTVGPVSVTPFEVSHPSGSMSCALRFSLEGKTLSFTGDTEWVEALVAAGQGADLYIMECFAAGGATRYHMAWPTIEANLPRIGAKRVLLTHMNAGMLARPDLVAGRREIILAEDGLVLRI